MEHKTAVNYLRTVYNLLDETYYESSDKNEIIKIARAILEVVMRHVGDEEIMRKLETAEYAIGAAFNADNDKVKQSFMRVCEGEVASVIEIFEEHVFMMVGKESKLYEILEDYNLYDYKE